MTLQEIWKVVPPEEYVYVGESTAFFFVGNKAEFFEIIPAEFLQKEVKSIYPRLDDGYAVILEGKQSGWCWDREEWLRRYEIYVAKGADFNVFLSSIHRGGRHYG